MFSKLLVALDQSSLSQVVWQRALDLARTLNAQLKIVHVLSEVEVGYPPLMTVPDSGLYPGISDVPIAEYQQQCEAFERESLQQLQAHATEAVALGLQAEATQTAGDPGRVICDLAKTWNVDMILIGNRGRTGLTELLLGSVSNYVTHHAPCSVLVVRVPTQTDPKPSAITSY